MLLMSRQNKHQIHSNFKGLIRIYKVLTWNVFSKSPQKRNDALLFFWSDGLVGFIRLTTFFPHNFSTSSQQQQYKNKNVEKKKNQNQDLWKKKQF